MPDANHLTVHAGEGLIHAPAAAGAKLKAEMANEAFRTLLTNHPQQALNQVGIIVDSKTALTIKNQLAGGHGVSPNAIITVTAIA
jgi:hypothetical protein